MSLVEINPHIAIFEFQKNTSPNAVILETKISTPMFALLKAPWFFLFTASLTVIAVSFSAFF
jgi:hypothetical protein